MKKRTTKGIISLESWDGSDSENASMQPILRFVSDFHGTKNYYKFLYTPEEMKYILNNVPTRNFSLLYLALHGNPNKIHTGMYTEFEISLNDLAEMMGKRFQGFGLHLASCAVMSSSQESIYDFMDKTGILFMSGYDRYVDFMSSSLVDLSLINNWMFARNYKLMFKKMFKSSVRQLLNENGFTYYA